ncbi:MAG: hypothetical protein M3P41_12495 [Actinomycetota bacterium]|nr:hypothetical protein [Actinomycetota bacterium]
MKLLRTRISELGQRLAELEERRSSDVDDATARIEALRVADLAAAARMQGIEDVAVELRQRVAQWTGQ